MEITLKKLDGSSPELPAVLELYESAFPANERREPDEIIGGEDGAGELLAVMSGGALCGMLAVLTYRDITHILYFAVMPERRRSSFRMRSPSEPPGAGCAFCKLATCSCNASRSFSASIRRAESSSTR